MSVSVKPGAIANARTLSLAKPRAMVLVSATSAPFEAA